MAKPISAQTIWSIMSALVVVLVGGGMAYMFFVTAAVPEIQPQPKQFATNAITELTRDADLTGLEKFSSNVFFKTTKMRALPVPYDGKPAVPYNRTTEFGKSDLSSDK